jgi:hypothetical protein
VIGHGGGGFSMPLFAALVFVSPPLGGPEFVVAALGAEVEELPEQPAAKPIINIRLAAIHFERFIRTPRYWPMSDGSNTRPSRMPAE